MKKYLKNFLNSHYPIIVMTILAMIGFIGFTYLVNIIVEAVRDLLGIISWLHTDIA